MSNSLVSNTQVITFQGDEESQVHELIESDVIVYATIKKTSRGSSKVKLKNIVDYKWETKNYPGHLIAVHTDGICVAYVIKVTNKVSGSEGMVRVISGGKRALIKGMTGEVLDIQFAYNEKQHILACAEENALHIYKIDITADKLICQLQLEIHDSISNCNPKYHKVAWCPYIPDDIENDEDANQLMVWARGHSFQCFSISTILKCYGKGKHFIDTLREGHLKFTDKAVIITWVALSPDGTTLSVGSNDGYIRFYQVYFHEKEPRCLHQWNPHNGKPISSFFFLDNLTKSSSDAYWKHSLTGAASNTEIKIWDCGTWDCLQILSFRSDDTDNLSFCAEIDMSSSYLILSSIEINVLYVVQLVSSTKNGETKLCMTKNRCDSTTCLQSELNNRGHVLMKSISEFPLSSPILSFCIVDATVSNYKYQEAENLLSEDTEENDEESTTYCVVIRMFVIQPKSVQECHIIYQPTVTDTADVRSVISSVFDLVDISLVSTEKTVNLERLPESEIYVSNDIVLNPSSSPNAITATSRKASNHQNLMTPNSFKSSCGKNDDDLCPPVPVRLPSGGSSPSREVQQILSTSPISQNMNFYLVNIENEPKPLEKNVNAADDQFQNAMDSKFEEATIWPQRSNAEKAKNYDDKSNVSQVIDYRNTDINDLSVKMGQVLKIIECQAADLHEIKKEIKNLRKENQCPGDTKHVNFSTELIISKAFEEGLVKHEKSLEKRLENMISERRLQCQEFSDNILVILREFLYDQFSEKQTHFMSSEIQKQIAAVVSAKLDVIENNVQSEVAKKLANTEMLIKENVSHLCKSKSFMDAFGDSIIVGVQKGLQNAYIQSMSSTLIPAYEKSSKEMFKQLHETFSLGIKDVIEQFDGYLCQLQPFQESMEEISEKMRCVIKDMENTVAKQSMSDSAILAELKKRINSLETSVFNNITDTIQKEIRKNFETQAATLEDSVLSVVRSQAHTPAPSVYDVQDQIRYLLYQGQINKAFHQALIANDLVLVEYVLQKAEYKLVFNPCALEQTVLLSLIQQISADMENHNDLKQRYLADALLNLNQNDPITKEHAPRVIKEFCKNCQNFLKNYPKNHLCGNIRMILMAVQGMGYKMV